MGRGVPHSLQYREDARGYCAPHASQNPGAALLWLPHADAEAALPMSALPPALSVLLMLSEPLLYVCPYCMRAPALLLYRGVSLPLYSGSSTPLTPSGSCTKPTQMQHDTTPTVSRACACSAQGAHATDCP